MVGNGLAAGWIGRVSTGSSVLANADPTVALTAPAAGSRAPGDIALAANAADGDGRVTRVEFHRGTTLIATDTTAPYTAIWSGATAGTWQLTARAYDDEGSSTTSAAVTVTVADPADTTVPVIDGVRVVLRGRVPVGATTVTVVQTGTTVTPDSDGSFAVPITVPAGMTDFTILWQDAAGIHERTLAVGPAPDADG